MRTVALLCSLVLLTGCVSITRPLDTDVYDTTLGEKSGRATSHQILGMVAWGDRGTEAAAKQGDITTIRHMDIHTFRVLWFVYGRDTTIVYGD